MQLARNESYVYHLVDMWKNLCELPNVIGDV